MSGRKDLLLIRESFVSMTKELWDKSDWDSDQSTHIKNK